MRKQGAVRVGVSMFQRDIDVVREVMADQGCSFSQGIRFIIREWNGMFQPNPKAYIPGAEGDEELCARPARYGS